MRNLDFARSQPVIYEAMFILPTTLPFASARTPAALRAGFAESDRNAFRPLPTKIV